MSRTRQTGPGSAPRFPRVSGDEPAGADSENMRDLFPPRERG